MNVNEPNPSWRRRWPKLARSRKLVLLVLLILMGGLAVTCWRLTSRRGLAGSATRILVLDNCDDDFRTPPFEDAVIGFRSDGTPVPKVGGFNICQTVGACRALSVSKDGGFFVVCENVSQKLTACQWATGARLWSLTNTEEVVSATVSSNGTVYALTSAGTIYGKDTLVIDRAGHIARQASVGGFDLVLDEARDTLWLVGSNVTQCDRELNVLRKVNCIRWCAVSVDVNRDGSIWVAEREHPNVGRSTNRIFQISPAGKLLISIGLPFSPACLRVDRSDGSVWVTGGTAQPTGMHRLLNRIEKRTGPLPIGKRAREFLTRYRGSPRTHKYDARGVLLCDLAQGGFSLDVDPVDGSLWIAGREKVLHYSRQGKKLGQSGGLSFDQKYILVVPRPVGASPAL